MSIFLRIDSVITLGTLRVLLPLVGHIFDNKEIDQRNVSTWVTVAIVWGHWSLGIGPGNAESFEASALFIFTFIKMKKISKINV